jgi:hypothetical protein
MYRLRLHSLDVDSVNFFECIRHNFAADSGHNEHLQKNGSVDFSVAHPIVQPTGDSAFPATVTNCAVNCTPCHNMYRFIPYALFAILNVSLLLMLLD